MEMQDTYVRLDRSIAALLDLIDRKVGLHNVVFCITSTGYADPEAPDLGLYRIPGGILPEPLRHPAEHVSHGHVWRRTVRRDLS